MIADKAHQFSLYIHAGMTAINHNGLALPAVLIGGFKDLSHGTEGSSEARSAYSMTKLIIE